MGSGKIHEVFLFKIKTVNEQHCETSFLMSAHYQCEYACKRCAASCFKVREIRNFYLQTQVGRVLNVEIH